MAKNWSVNANQPHKRERYEWHFPKNDQEHVEETVAPTDMNIKPSQVNLKPKLSPASGGVQTSTTADWTYQSTVDSSWYVLGDIVQEDD